MKTLFIFKRLPPQKYPSIKIFISAQRFLYAADFPHTLHSSRKPRFQGPLALGLRPPKAFLEKAAIIAINLFRRQIAVFRRGLRLASRCPRSQPLHHGTGASSAELFPPAGFFILPQVLFLNPRVLSAERRYLCKKTPNSTFFYSFISVSALFSLYKVI